MYHKNGKKDMAKLIKKSKIASLKSDNIYRRKNIGILSSLSKYFRIMTKISFS